MSVENADWLPLPNVARAYFAERGQLQPFESYLAKLTRLAGAIYLSFIFVLSIVLAITLFCLIELAADPHDDRAWLILVGSMVLALPLIRGWAWLQHDDVFKRWLLRVLVAPPAALELFDKIRGNQISTIVGGTTANSFFDSGICQLLCSHDHLAAKLVRTKHNMVPKQVVMIRGKLPSTFDSDEPALIAQFLRHTDRPIPASISGQRVGCHVVPKSKPKGNLAAPTAAPEGTDLESENESTPDQGRPDPAPTIVTQLHAYDWVRSLGIDLGEAIARIDGLDIPTEVAEPAKTRQGLKHALSFLIKNPNASLQMAVTDAEKLLIQEFGSPGKRGDSSRAAWLGAIIKRPPTWLLKGMQVPSARPPLGAILDLPIHHAPPRAR